MELGEEYLRTAVQHFEKYRQLAERSLAQVTDDRFFAAPDAESNSIALIVKHMAGNLRSRWTDFLTADGEKPDRDRDAEFEVHAADTRAGLMEAWERGWECAFRELGSLAPADLVRTVRIRGEPHSVVQAIERQLTHAAYHVGQIVFLAKHHAAGSWRTLSIPRKEPGDGEGEGPAPRG